MSDIFERKSSFLFYKGIDGESCHFNAPAGGGGPGGFMQPGPFGIWDYRSNGFFPHPNSPAGRYLTPEKILKNSTPKNSGQITLALLKAADSSNKEKYYESILDIMNQYAKTYAIDTPLRIAHFLAQIGHESGFKMVEEGGSYTAKRMRKIFGCKGGAKNYDAVTDDASKGRLRDKLWTEEAKYANNSKNLLNYVYSSRMGNGDEASGDGYKYRGRGMMQLTGKNLYKKFTTTHNKKNPSDQRDFEASPELLNEISYGVESAFFYWDSRNINTIADSDNLTKVTIAVNGGTNGLPDREARLKRIKKELGI